MVIILYLVRNYCGRTKSVSVQAYLVETQMCLVDKYEFSIIKLVILKVFIHGYQKYKHAMVPSKMRNIEFRYYS